MILHYCINTEVLQVICSLSIPMLVTIIRIIHTEERTCEHQLRYKTSNHTCRCKRSFLYDFQSWSSLYCESYLQLTSMLLVGIYYMVCSNEKFVMKHEKYNSVLKEVGFPRCLYANYLSNSMSSPCLGSDQSCYKQTTSYTRVEALVS